MTLRDHVETLYEEQVAEFLTHPEFRALESGTASPEAYDDFAANVVRAHLKASQLVAFLYAVAPPASADGRLQNLLDELHHPGLLRQFAVGAGLADRLPEVEAMAADDIRRVVAEPLLYGTLKDLGLAALCEIVAFEYMLTRIAGRIAAALTTHRGLSPKTLTWWTEHAEVDREHAEQGLADLEAYVRFYDFDPEDARAIVEMTLRENVFIKRYLGEFAAACVQRGRGA
jgi:Iron-containing redox enzyme